MAGLAGHIASLGRYLTEHERRGEADSAALGELSAGAERALDLPAGLEIEWLGTAGYRVTYEGQSIYIDPYVSRVSLADVLRRRPAQGRPALHQRWLAPAGRTVGVLVGHTHFDHAIDVPALCSRHGCKAYGSGSLAHLMRLHGLGDDAVEVTPHVPFELGPFKVTFVPSRHSKLLVGYAVPSDGELSCEHLDALSPTAYRCGQVWAIHIEVAGISLYHQGSADLIDSEVRHRGVDIFLAGIAGRRFTDRYWERILGLLEPRVVVASHFDDFLRTLDRPAGFSLNVNLAAFPEEVQAVSGDFTVAALPAFRAVAAKAPAGRPHDLTGSGP